MPRDGRGRAGGSARRSAAGCSGRGGRPPRPSRASSRKIHCTRPPCVSACSTTTTPPGRSSRVRGALDAADGVQAVLAGEQRQLGVVVASLGRDVLPLGQRDVRRVGDDQVHLAVQLGQRGTRASRLISRSGTRPAAVDVARGPRRRRRRTAPRRGPGRAAPPALCASAIAPEPVHRSTISGSATSSSRSGVDRPADHDLGLRPRHEHPGADLRAPGSGSRRAPVMCCSGSRFSRRATASQ